MKSSRTILVTNALTYANGDLHLGHLVGYIMSDIWVRFQKMRGHHCTFICGSDCHGTPIMIKAQQENLSPEAMVANIQQRQAEDCKNFFIDLDDFYTTHSPENKLLCEKIYLRLQQNGDIIQRDIEQLYDPIKNMFLPDRFVKGECPRCGAKDQYGDNCESCGATYATTELKNPLSILSNSAPIKKISTHYFFDLPKYTERLQAWINSNHLQEQVAHKLDEWFQQGLQVWDISRDAPYFGFNIPNLIDKYFYVWLDAPIGYISIFKHLCEQRKDLHFDHYWQKNSNVELYHFLGKDITYFHALFWPAVLMAADYRLPTSNFTHGFLTINGEKMSKSRGTFITARQYLKHLQPEYLRYYLATKLSNSIEDIDLNLEDFRLRVNADLIGKVINIASRCAGFIHHQFTGKLSAQIANQELFQQFAAASETIATYYEKREFSKATREIMNLADQANQYINDEKPWKLIKEVGQEAKVQAICTVGLNLFRQLIIYLKPVLPQIAIKTEQFLNIKPLTWEDSQTWLLDHQINAFVPMMQRIEENYEL